MRVLNVLPSPPYHTHPNTAVHIILEQGLHPQKVAIHFTTIFLGGARVGLFQRAESAPERLCTQQMIDRHGFQLQCNFRQCHMHSGLLRFAMNDPEEIFSGISVVLTVAPPPPEPQAASLARQLEEHPSSSAHDQNVDSDEADLMQITSSSPEPQARCQGICRAQAQGQLLTIALHLQLCWSSGRRWNGRPESSTSDVETLLSLPFRLDRGIFIPTEGSERRTPEWLHLTQGRTPGTTPS